MVKILATMMLCCWLFVCPWDSQAQTQVQLPAQAQTVLPGQPQKQLPFQTQDQIKSPNQLGNQESSGLKPLDVSLDASLKGTNNQSPAPQIPPKTVFPKNDKKENNEKAELYKKKQIPSSLMPTPGTPLLGFSQPNGISADTSLTPLSDYLDENRIANSFETALQSGFTRKRQSAKAEEEKRLNDTNDFFGQKEQKDKDAKKDDKKRGATSGTQ